MKNPLRKRLLRELKNDIGKYLVIFLFMTATIGFVSGMYVANESMITSANEGVTKYKQEDGHFELKKQADATLLSAIETGEKADFKATKTTLYENFFRNEEEDYNNDGKKDGTIRVFAKTKDINLACMLQGSFPQKADEIAIDRMHADNVGIKVAPERSPASGPAHRRHPAPAGGRPYTRATGISAPSR